MMLNEFPIDLDAEPWSFVEGGPGAFNLDRILGDREFVIKRPEAVAGILFHLHVGRGNNQVQHGRGADIPLQVRANRARNIVRLRENLPDDMVRCHGGDELKAVRAMCRFQLEWTSRMLQDFETRPETLHTEVQAVRIGDLYCAANASEFFSPFAIVLRQQSEVPHLMLGCYANGRIGYLPDEYDINARSYAGYQSPKYCNQFPFTSESGPQMCVEILRVVEHCRTLALDLESSFNP